MKYCSLPLLFRGKLLPLCGWVAAERTAGSGQPDLAIRCPPRVVQVQRLGPSHELVLLVLPNGVHHLLVQLRDISTAFLCAGSEGRHRDTEDRVGLRLRDSRCLLGCLKGGLGSLDLRMELRAEGAAGVG